MQTAARHIGGWGGGPVRPLLLILALLLGACTTVLARNPVPEDETTIAAPYGIDAGGRILRDWGDDLVPGSGNRIVARWAELARVKYADEIARGGPIREVSLALSGGGPDGAFGAGLLKGWTERGDRPEFTVVTGISTGAIIALFAFLGPDYDDELTEIYTTYQTSDLLRRTIFAGLTGGTALTDTRGYRALIERYVDDDVVAHLGAEARRGRVLLIGTTNLDAARPVIWNIAGIAATGDPNAKRLIHDVIQASSAIPAAFPPVLIPVEGSDGRRYDEMHVDGGATQQVMFFSPKVPMRQIDAAVGVPFERTLYVVINNKLRKPYDPVRPRLIPIAGTAVSSLLGGAGTGDIYKIFAIAVRDGIDLNVLAIPPEFDREPDEPFDPVYMKALYDLGRDYGRAGDRWSPAPPDFAPWPAPPSGAGGS
ncbi:patatin-like phospholipase family protein [Limibaculum sp. FT325]|uniref:patatin-like phospholipase family protein n=1 Tax=Thermohalobaculum sediminis TaxID=2939436 RepID=UPI0020BEAA75|nr:patatin-like phospholipase family protein [Limibaculum sediminis]MCL5776103.1 patatin-like phospholipase family protein [Limibaculum sediminis]